jgi:spore germination protein YaaH
VTPAVVLCCLAALIAVPSGAAAGVRKTGPVRASQAAGLQAFVLAGAPDSLADLQAHSAQIAVAYPTYFECEPLTGGVSGEDTGTITAYARAHGIAVLPRFNCQSGAAVHTLLTDPRVRARTLAALERIALNPSYAGLNLDLENDGAADRAAMTSFVTTLATYLHAHGRRLAVDIVGVAHEEPRHSTYFYDDRALAAAADHVFVMAWGTHWASSAPGPIAPLPYVSEVVRFLVTLPNAARFVLGAPMYGLDWPTTLARGARGGATALQYAGVVALIHATGAQPLRDRTMDEPTFTYTRAGVAHRVWYMDAQAIADNLRLARAHGLGGGVWRLGQEDQGVWSLAL